MQHARSDLLSEWLREVRCDEAFGVLAELDPEAAVYAVNAAREVVYWSEGARRLLGYEPEEVLGKHCLTMSRCEDCMRGCGMEEHGVVTGHGLLLRLADGKALHMRKTGRAFFDERGVFLGGVERLVPVDAAHHEPIETPDAAIEFHGMVTRDPSMRRVFQTIRNVAETDVTALVRGESGSGKELVARALHAESPRRLGPFIAVNSAALTESLMESELFGHVRGAFTGASRDRDGLFAQATGGTLFLDEVAELQLQVQAKLLRVLEAGEVVPVGGDRPVPVDVRVVAATHRSLRAAVKAGRFREDLMYRLRVVPIFLPPLRERREDVEVLVWHFIHRRNEAGRRLIETISPEAMRALMDHRWPGNVRELSNVVAYAFAVSRGTDLGLDDLPPELRAVPDLRTVPPSPMPVAAPHTLAHAVDVGAGPAAHIDPSREAASSDAASVASPRELRDRALRARIIEALAHEEGNLGRTAERLGVSRATLWRWRKRLGL